MNMTAHDNFFGNVHNLFQLFQAQQSELGEKGRDTICSKDRTRWRNSEVVCSAEDEEDE